MPPIHATTADDVRLITPSQWHARCEDPLFMQHMLGEIGHSFADRAYFEAVQDLLDEIGPEVGLEEPLVLYWDNPTHDIIREERRSPTPDELASVEATGECGNVTVSLTRKSLLTDIVTHFRERATAMLKLADELDANRDTAEEWAEVKVVELLADAERLKLENALAERTYGRV